jgi:hypothetical protein
MKIKIIHPVWTHIPALAALIYFIVRLVLDRPLPARAAIHFNWQGQPDSYGSPWLGFGITIGLSVFFIVISTFLDEIWARQEKVKIFNWLSLFDDIVVGMLVGISLGNLAFITAGVDQFHLPWAYLGWTAGITTIMALAFEWLRPFRSNGQAVPDAQSLSTLEKDYARRVQEHKAFVYWESQNPVYVTLLTIVVPLIMLGVAVITWFSQPWAALVVLIAALGLVIPYGGLRTVITADDISVFFGLPGFRVLRLKVRDIASIELKEYAPLRDFGGYGIRFNGRITAYYMCGNRGVLLVMPGGKQVLLGSDHPEQLLAVIRAVSGRKN